jgi:hypothetical protein
VTSLKALFRLDTTTPELYEMRKIVATRDIDEVTVRLGLPQAPDGQVAGDLVGGRPGGGESDPDGSRAARIQRLDLNDETRGQDRVVPDSNGDVAEDFNGLREGYGYGVAWTQAP